MEEMKKKLMLDGGIEKKYMKPDGGNEKKYDARWRK